MTLLLDTHVLIWLFEGDPRLGQEVRRAIEDAAVADALAVSAITFWEVGMLVRKKRVGFDKDVDGWIDYVLATPGMSLILVDQHIAARAGQLPDELHGDPADRILVSTAQSRRIALVTADEPILAYAAAGHLEAIDARL